MTALMTPRPDPFTDAVCREPNRLARWWDVDARDDERAMAASLCALCPARVACTDAAATLGDGASGTWAGQYRPWAGGAPIPHDDAMAEFLAVFGPSGTTTDLPPPHTPKPQPVRYGRYWLHPAQLRLHLELKEAN